MIPGKGAVEPKPKVLLAVTKEDRNHLHSRANCYVADVSRQFSVTGNWPILAVMLRDAAVKLIYNYRGQSRMYVSAGRG